VNRRQWLLLLLAAAAGGAALGIALARTQGPATEVSGFMAAWPQDVRSSGIMGPRTIEIG
jgi:hypothetical protein